MEEYRPVKRHLTPSEAEGDIFKDSGMHAAILVSNFVNVTLLANAKQTEAAPLSACRGRSFLQSRILDSYDENDHKNTLLQAKVLHSKFYLTKSTKMLASNILEVQKIKELIMQNRPFQDNELMWS